MKRPWLILIVFCAVVMWRTGNSSVHAKATTESTDSAKTLVQEPIQPARVIRRADAVFFIDFGRDAFGYLELELAAPAAEQAGRKIVVRLGEKLNGADHIDRKPGGSVRFLETSVTTVGGRRVYRPELTKKDERLMPVYVGAVMPFRYAELENLPETTAAEQLRTHAVRQVAVHLLFDDAAADFACSDTNLNAIWDLCKYSMKATSFAGLMVDGDRERKPYEADLYINQLGWQYCTGDNVLPRRSHEYLLSHPTWPTEWIMFSVLTGWQDYLFSGDPMCLAAHYEDLKADALRGLEREDGLISSVEPPVPQAVSQSIHFNGKLKDNVDWPEGEQDGYKMVAVNTVVNAFHCRSLTLMADVAETLGKTDDAVEFRRAAAHAVTSLNNKLVDPQSELYVDGEGTTHCSLHANLFPLAFGLVPAERQAKVLDFVRSRGMACSVYGAQFLMDGLFDHGCGADAVRLMTAPGDRSWRHMVQDTGTTITLEAWDTRYKPNQDWNHAWGAAPANLLPRMILGVEPLQAGYGKTLIWPRCAGKSAAGTVSWARGKVPTPKGAILVNWHQTAAGFQMTIELPSTTSALVRLPLDWGERILVDAKPVTGLTHGRSVEVELLRPGRHVVAVGQ
ncbi:MAG TPA: alpha-L-rhamnosidase C-terminal domain-containing protein [Tepidisphaeraceae bacterium]|nr:alpha-L-rhamnosidase C-terminal domain-containing protein [Tepidisphaeraceae bacterium]